MDPRVVLKVMMHTRSNLIFLWRFSLSRTAHDLGWIRDDESTPPSFLSLFCWRYQSSSFHLFDWCLLLLPMWDMAFWESTSWRLRRDIMILVPQCNGHCINGKCSTYKWRCMWRQRQSVGRGHDPTWTSAGDSTSESVHSGGLFQLCVWEVLCNCYISAPAISSTFYLISDHILSDFF